MTFKPLLRCDVDGCTEIEAVRFKALAPDGDKTITSFCTNHIQEARQFLRAGELMCGSKFHPCPVCGAMTTMETCGALGCRRND